ncbi:thrombospondin type-1 domain-containing protein 7A [Cyclospora cayetanensis]|uniref:Thrombospondin type-1 domain-containing protein 7A n=1 Tax=Cyclospora cayetanensis TaxID=88456 RepID=A0A6P6RX37_9EIME|nr:thrombospondin type-1 domain-containing protein 7A [Cyclospora cayetanensis]
MCNCASDSNVLQGQDAVSFVADQQGPETVAQSDANFKKAYEQRLQVPQESSFSLKFMQQNRKLADPAFCAAKKHALCSLYRVLLAECQILWGKVEIVTKRKSQSKIAQTAKDLLTSCNASAFSAVSGGETSTWRECAAKLSGTTRFFSWVKQIGQLQGTCSLLGYVSKKEDEEENAAACLRDAHSDEIAVTGMVDDPLCTSCEVSSWTDTPCSTWCEAGVAGRYRTILSHASQEYCAQGNDQFCDMCPHLWEIKLCNQDTKCGALVEKNRAPIQPGAHYCPTQNTKTKVVTSWRQCSEECFNAFEASGGNSLDPSTYAEASCFHYSFNNSTSSCELKNLVSCNNRLTTDSLWISGDVLSLPSADYSTVVFSEWSQWSSCEDIDAQKGWKKRRRNVSNWGFKNDQAELGTNLYEVASCLSGESIEPEETGNPPEVTCCLYGDFVEWSEAHCNPTCGSDRFQIRKKRRLQNPVPNVDGDFDPTCALDKCKQDGQQAESKRCDNVPECTSDCVYMQWTEWSSCTCNSSSEQSGTMSRVRKAVSGTICPDMNESEECADSSCKQESSNMTYIYAACGSVGALLLLGGAFALRKHNVSAMENAQTFETM